ncbi:hypothetical protein F4777DRAFT_156979 [Nemania sp. FL0916]|nr:hypothetical protein F4777DRAFT_156979 [Nemania sp. FL0916]
MASDSGPTTAFDAGYHEFSNNQAIYHRVLEALNEEAERSSKAGGHPSRYASVNVLMLQWEGDDLGVNAEVDALAQVFSRDFGFSVDLFYIPLEKSLRRLTTVVTDWVDRHDRPDNLFILYYAGHGRISGSGRTVVWSNRMVQDDSCRELKWTGCEDVLHEAVSDKLFMYDCCYAAGLAAVGEGGVSETICASGFESLAPRPGPHSFTTALTYVLRQMASLPRPFSVSIVYTAVLAYLKELDPAQIAPDGIRIADAQDHAYSLGQLRRLEFRRTPVHFVKTHHLQAPDIQLFRLAQGPDYIDLSHPRDAGADETSADKDRYHLPVITLKVHPTANLVAQDADAARRWLRAIPLPLGGVTIETGVPQPPEKTRLQEEAAMRRRFEEMERALEDSKRLMVDAQDLSVHTSRETRTIHMISLVSLVFLPGTFVATFISSGSYLSDGGGYLLSWRNYIFLFFILSSILAAVTFFCVSLWTTNWRKWKKREEGLPFFVDSKKFA